jgi:hypothetical protein
MHATVLAFSVLETLHGRTNILRIADEEITAATIDRISIVDTGDRRNRRPP